MGAEIPVTRQLALHRREGHVDVSTLIADRLAFAALPNAAPTAQWAGYRRSNKCDGCDLPIHTKQIEDEFDFADGRRIRLHRDCSIEWSRQTSQD